MGIQGSRKGRPLKLKGSSLLGLVLPPHPLDEGAKQRPPHPLQGMWRIREKYIDRYLFNKKK